MVTRIDKKVQLALIEHVAHLTSSDYAEVPNDLLLLGFIAPDQADLIEDSGIVELLADIYGAWSSGGGAAAINVNDVVSRLQDLTADKGNPFQIPPYFAYIAKSFSVLEGIGLSNNPKYSIIKECMPYVSKRLLTDKEMLGPALNTFVFGSEKSDPDRIVDYKRVEQLIEGFTDYTSSASGALLGKDAAQRTEILENAAEQVLDLVLTEEETPLQDIMLDQLAKIVTAESRNVWTKIRERSGVLPSGRTVLGTMFDPLGLWRTSPLVRMNELDERTVDTSRRLISLVQKSVRESGHPVFDLSTLSREEIVAFTSILVRKVWQRRLGLVMTGNRFARKLLQLTANKLAIGERNTRLLSPPPNLSELQRGGNEGALPPSTSNDPVLSATPASSRTFRRQSPTQDSARLQQARRMLDEWHDQDQGGESVVQVRLD